MVVATFDVDQLHDYRARRPPMSFVRDHYEGYDAPRLVVRLLHDSGRTPYLLLHGPEPDTRWEAFCRGRAEVVERFSVPGLSGWARCRWRCRTPGRSRSPTTPTTPTCSPAPARGRGELRIPSSAQALLEVRLGEWGHDALGFVAHVPHYLAQLDYPRASVALLEQVELAARLTIDLTDLARRGGRARGGDRPLPRRQQEVDEVVTALEQQYDAFARAEERRLQPARRGPAAPDG